MFKLQWTCYQHQHKQAWRGKVIMAYQLYEIGECLCAVCQRRFGKFFMNATNDWKKKVQRVTFLISLILIINLMLLNLSQ